MRDIKNPNPALVAVCLNCTMPFCRGMCDNYRREQARVYGIDYKPFPDAILYEYHGERRTIREWSALLDIKVNTIRSRLYKGLTFAEAVEYRFREKNVARYTIGDKTLTLKEWAAFTGVCYGTIIYRMSRGQSLETALRRKSATP